MNLSYFWDTDKGRAILGFGVMGYGVIVACLMLFEYRNEIMLPLVVGGLMGLTVVVVLIFFANRRQKDKARKQEKAKQ